jgi:hypothetical protein
LPKARNISPGKRAIIAELERDGHDIKQAHALLETLLESQALHDQHRGWLLRQLMGSSLRREAEGREARLI